MSYGVPMRIVVGGNDLFGIVPQLLPFGTSVNADPQSEAETFTLLPPSRNHGYQCFVGAELVLENVEAAPVLEQFSSELMKHVSNYCPDRVFVHAGVVGWKANALVLPGTTFAGKTTLTAALVRAGATYYSDEFALVDARGWVHPYARDLRMRKPGKREQHNTSVASLPGQAGTVPLRVTQVVFARYEPGARWNPQPISPGMAALELIRHSMPVQRVPRMVMSFLTAMLEGAAAWSSPRGEADEVAKSILLSLESGAAFDARPLREEEALA
jgi:hypothetical protein